MIASFRYSSAVVARIRPSQLESLRALPVVDYVMADGVARVESARMASPLSSQDTAWGVFSTRAPEVWNGSLGPTTKGSGVTVTLIDSGLDAVHLASGDGPVPVWHCLYHSLSVDPTQGPHCYANEEHHGAFMGGIIAAADNQEGVIGVAPELSAFNSLKVCKKTKECSLAAIQSAVEWAIMLNQPRHIINISLGTCLNSSSLRTALQAAANAGILVIAAAGNGRSNANSCLGQGSLGNVDVKYPARYPEVMAISGFIQDNTFAWPPKVGSSPPPTPCDPLEYPQGCPVDPELSCGQGSRYGPEVDLSAPYFAWSLKRNGEYGGDCGTSASVAFVSGAAALVWSRNPSLTAAQVRDRLKANAVFTWDSYQFGSGRLDAAAATYAASPPPPPVTVSILGVDTVVASGYHTWNASASGGTGSYTYAWSWALSGSPFTALGSGSSAQLYVDETTAPELWIRLDVTSGAQTGTHTKYVVNHINHNPCAPYVCLIAPVDSLPR